jgi:hypothetical protein
MSRLIVVPWLAIFLVLGGCHSPEDGRPRGDGPGGDGGNYRQKPVHAPSKIDGTKAIRTVGSSIENYETVPFAIIKVHTNIMKS